MSKFLTKVPFFIQHVIDRLPKGSTVSSVKWNGTSIDVEWENMHLETPFTFPFEFPLDDIDAKRVPDGVKNNQPKTVNQDQPTSTLKDEALSLKKSVDEAPKKVDKKRQQANT